MPGTLQPAVEAIFLTLSSINYLILIPISIYFMICFWKHKKEPYFHTRRPKLTIYSSLCILFVLIFHPFVLLFHFHSYFHVFDHNENAKCILHILLLSISILPLFPVVLRLWLCYYRFKYADALFMHQYCEVQNSKKNDLYKINTKLTSVLPLFLNTKSVHTASSIGENSYHLQSYSISKQLATNMADINPSTPTMTTDMVKDDIKENHNHTQSFSMNFDTICLQSFSNELQWWIDNKHTFGKTKPMVIFTIFLYIMYCCLILIFSFVGYFLVTYFIQAMISVLVWMVFFVKVIRNISPFKDQFFVRSLVCILLF